MIRFFDVCISFIFLLLLFPLLLLIAFTIKISSGGPVIFLQQRVGRNEKEFTLYKFRTMRRDSQLSGTLTIGEKDERVTSIGRILRKYKIDELPQLLNVLCNDMSLVGPRPELKKYVKTYTMEQKKILLVKPGITDYASIKFRNESVLLAAQPEPELFYINTILPDKVKLSQKCISKINICTYFRVIFDTLLSIFTPIS